MQRVFDLIFSSVALVVLSPVFVVTIVCLKFTGEGEAFYLQSRIGKDVKCSNFGLLC